MDHVDTGHHFEQLAGYMRCRAVAWRCYAELARVRLGIGNELTSRLGRERWGDLKGQSLAADACHRRDVADEIVVEPIVERRVYRALNRDQQERVPVSRRFGSRFDGDVAAPPWPVLDDEGLPKPLR